MSPLDIISNTIDMNKVNLSSVKTYLEFSNKNPTVFNKIDLSIRLSKDNMITFDIFEDDCEVFLLNIKFNPDMVVISLFIGGRCVIDRLNIRSDRYHTMGFFIKTLLRSYILGNNSCN